MSPPKTTIWALEKHTKAKHDILRRYLGAWFGIMAQGHSRIVYIDGFAGPGEYSMGEEGSPIIALRSVKDHRFPIKCDVVLMFVEADPARCAHLRGKLEQITLPSHIQVSAECGRFDEHMTAILDELDQGKKTLAPTFTFIDPFGFSGTPMSVVTRILGNPSCEVFITFMYESINRFLAHPDEKIARHFDELFGTAAWRPITEIKDPETRKRQLHDLYIGQLKGVAGARYVRSFEMIDRGNKTEYFLFFATKNLLGLKKMKEAMWVVDTGGGIAFSDTTDQNQFVLLGREPDAAALRKLILDWGKGRTVTAKQLEEFVLVETPFRETHYKKQVLVPLEKEGHIQILTKRKKTFTYPPGTSITFN